MTSALLALLRDLATPSTGGTRYGILVIAAAHALVGACLGSLLDLTAPAALLVGGLYWLLKEYLWDYRIRGAVGLRDGVVDGVFFTLGLLYPGDPWWPLAALGGASVVALAWKGNIDP